MGSICGIGPQDTLMLTPGVLFDMLELHRKSIRKTKGEG